MATQPFEIGHITIRKTHLGSYESKAKKICRHVARTGRQEMPRECQSRT